ncbi:hypothetical protein [Magnetospirillum molischianum]|uniref:Uncharacterized protein n=1 Tax=Magnetospirillum molischianum DSM 120 TaxID=1150626 RepID=H8FY12_MAGML|nr:hypothetical protein [Magnetospirillum molischianum]CCG43250.1 hypothetical protein PHAMO_80041 [Magnetospirillum molischianum DSM 120]
MTKQQERDLIAAQLQGRPVQKIATGKSGLDGEQRFKLKCAIHGDEWAAKRVAGRSVLTPQACHP